MMFGERLKQFVLWLGPWNIYFAFVGLMIGVFGGVTWRFSQTHERSLQRQATRQARFCRNCRWAMPEPTSRNDELGWRYARCMRPSARIRPEQFLVTGEDRLDDMNHCSNERARYGSCGPLGRFWERGPQLLEPAPQNHLRVTQ